MSESAIVDELEFALEFLGSFNVEEIESGIKVHTQFNKEYNFVLRTDIRKLRNIFINCVIGNVLRSYLIGRNCTYKLTEMEDRGMQLIIENNKKKWCYVAVFTFQKGLNE